MTKKSRRNVGDFPSSNLPSPCTARPRHRFYSRFSCSSGPAPSGRRTGHPTNRTCRRSSGSSSVLATSSGWCGRLCSLIGFTTTANISFLENGEGRQGVREIDIRRISAFRPKRMGCTMIDAACRVRLLPGHKNLVDLDGQASRRTDCSPPHGAGTLRSSPSSLPSRPVLVDPCSCRVSVVDSGLKFCWRLDLTRPRCPACRPAGFQFLFRRLLKTGLNFGTGPQNLRKEMLERQLSM